MPRLLREPGADPADILTLSFVTVDGAQTQASDYGDEADLLVFTPGIEREDPCAAMRASQAQDAG